jgi:hypothetical protein
VSERSMPILQEHQGLASDTTNPSEYVPNSDERREIKLVTRLFEKAKKHRKKYDEKWLDYYKMFRGKQWKEQRPSYRHSEVINFVFQAIQSSVPIVTDARPKFEFLPQEPQDLELATILTEVCQADWDSQNWNYTTAEVVYDGHFYGTGMGNMGFNPDADYGQGQITYESADPFYCFPDPNAHKVNDGKKRSRYFIYAEPVDIEVLKREYPEHKDHLKPDLIDLVQGEKTSLDQVKFKSPTDNKTVLEGQSAYDVGSTDQCLKITCYLYSDEFDEEEIKDRLDGGLEVSRYEQRLKYPNGQKICIAGGVHLHSGPIPFDDGVFPYARFVNYILPREFWGISEVEQLESPQKVFNKLVSFSLDVLTLMGNPVWVVDNNSGVDTDNLYNKPGLIIEKAPNTEVTRQEGVQLQPFVLQLIDRMETWFQDISGRSDVTQGINPSGVTAASAITTLQEAAQTRIRLKSRNLDAFLQDLGQLYLSRVFQFYSSPRIFRLTNNPNAQKYFKFYVESETAPDGQVQRKAVIRDYIPQPDGSMAESLQAREFQIRGGFDVKVTTGSSLPFAKAQKANLSFKLFEDGAIDEPALLEGVEYPNWEAVWGRVEQRKADMAAQQAQAEAAKAGGGAPPTPAGNPPLPPA